MCNYGSVLAAASRLQPPKRPMARKKREVEGIVIKMTGVNHKDETYSSPTMKEEPKGVLEKHELLRGQDKS